jgi:actin-related protein
MEKIWAHVYSRENLNVPSQDHAVLLTEAPLNPDANRAKAAELFFEGFNAPAMFCAPQVSGGQAVAKCSPCGMDGLISDSAVYYA